MKLPSQNAILGAALGVILAGLALKYGGHLPVLRDARQGIVGG